METLVRPGAGKPPTGKRMKARAPPPPNQPSAASRIHSEHKSPAETAVISDQNLVSVKENMINRLVDFTVILPSGVEQKCTVQGSKAVMDVLVDLCSQYRLNPSQHSLELKSSGTQQVLSYKPNTLIGALDVQTVLLKEKIPEEKAKRPLPRVPEKSVRLVVNYLKTQKAVVRVSPEVPLHNIIPAICEKCEVSQEHIVLLRDGITGEELELSKSLEELGIKELYAWDRKKVPPSKTQSEPSLNYREPNRKASVSSDAIEREKTRLLGLFNADRRNSKGFSTAPNSPSANSRSSSLGSSLSLGNISGMTANPEVKKRRAPPPPVATPVLPNVEARGQDRTAAQISQGASLNDLRKKKRRAPLPPAASAPPTPAMPNRTEDREDKRKSTMESLLSTHDNVYAVDDTVLELLEVEETASESSCFASEDTTEDSGVVSSPSDIVSLDSQNDSAKLRDIRMVNGYMDPAEADAMCGTETCPVQSAYCDSAGPDSAPLSRRDEAMALAKHENEDTFIAAQLQQTLADLDEDLEAVDDVSNSVSDYTSEALNPHVRKVEAAQDVSISVPVTIIDDAPEVSTSNSDENQEMEIRVSQNISADSVNARNFTNKNNNAGSFDKGHTDGGAVCKDLIYQQPSENEFIHLPVEQRRDMFESLTSSFEKRNEKNLRLEPSPKHGVKSEECKSKLSPSHSKATTEISTAKEKLNPVNECSSRERSLKKSKSELEIKWPPAKKTEVEVPSTPTWCHRAQNSGSSYEPKMGLTTFKVVPPKPEVRHFDRGVSLSTGAIKIDELGNLIGPNTSVSKHVQGSSSDESEEIHIGRVKAFWRSSSMEKQSDDSAEQFPKKSAVTTNSKPFTIKHDHKPVCLAAPKPAAPQTVTTTQVAERQSENERSKPALSATQSQVTPLAVPAVSKDKLELPFVKPHRRTSSQYVASAIARHINATTFKSDPMEYNEKDENKQGAGEVKNEAEVSPKRCIIVAKDSPVETESAETRETLPSIFACSQKASHRFTPGDNSGMENKVVNIRAPNQATPVSFYKKNACAPLTKSSSKDNNSADDDHGLNSKQSVAEKKTVFDQKCETLIHTNSASSLKSPDLQGVPSSFSSSLRVTKWRPANGVQVSSLKASPELNGAAANAESEQEEKPDDSDVSTVGELDVNVQTNIFGPKKKFKPVIQKPVPKDTSLHSALMEAIQTGGGKEKLRKVSNSALNGSHGKPSYTEPENERSALLAAIRGHSGTSKLKKISSLASQELQHFRDAERSLQKAEDPQEEQLCIPPAPAQPPPPPPIQLSAAAPKSSVTASSNPAEARQALLEAIRSGAGAAKLRKVPLLV
ncbi:protein cordon-bleu isoform X8 [Hirundo rustica]|uniref:protein cordon-bleu isoform X8 n=1 Tax=Hirundo rustica TaxID=43150 RepID=UPI001A944447|nr:protein cordon-bleu isoform X8 [Hirundo rustica]